jgi:hypothetical protein
MTVSDTVAVALIGLGGIALTQIVPIITLIKMHRVEHNVNGINNALRDKLDVQGVALGTANARADQAEGNAQGRKDQRDQDDAKK